MDGSFKGDISGEEISPFSISYSGQKGIRHAKKEPSHSLFSFWRI